MTIFEFIQRALEGGWRGEFAYSLDAEATKWAVNPDYPAERILLDPEAWKAVGKSMGWGKKNHDPVWKVTYNVDEHTITEPWANAMLDFTYHLAEDHTLPEALGMI